MSKLKLEVRNFIKHHWLIITLVTAIFFLGLALIPAYRYQINPDATSYVTIAQKYADGDLANAVNGYWGPLLSWLAVPFLWLGIDPLIAMKLLQVLVTCGITAIAYLILRTLNFRPLLATFGASICGVISLDWALSGELSSDLLSSFLVMVILYLFMRYHQRSLSAYSQILLGTAGALLYFAKSIGLFLFLGMWLIWIAADWLGGKGSFKNILLSIKARLLSLLVFILIGLPFVALISIKYDRPTIGTAGPYNFALYGPHSVGHPMLDQLLPPPNESALSIWEDVSNVPIVNWSPFSSAANFTYFSGLVRKNIADGFHILAAKAGVILLLAFLYLLLSKKSQLEKYFALLAFLVCLLIFLAYVPIYVELRYLFPIVLIATFGYIGFVHRWLSANSYYSGLILMTIGLMALVWPLWHLNKNRGIGENIYQDSLNLRPYLNSSVNVAGDDLVSLYACFYTKSPCYSVINPSTPYLDRQLKRYSIKYLILGPQTANTLSSANLPLKKLPNTYYLGRNLYQVL